MPEEFVLHPATTLVELHHVKGISDLSRLGNGLVKDAAVGTREVEGRVAHAVEKFLTLSL